MNKNFELFFDRASRALGIRSLSELATLLNVNRSSITQARKKKLRTGQLVA
jgi:hypothetical protein